MILLPSRYQVFHAFFIVFAVGKVSCNASAKAMTTAPRKKLIDFQLMLRVFIFIVGNFADKIRQYEES